MQEIDEINVRLQKECPNISLIDSNKLSVTYIADTPFFIYASDNGLIFYSPIASLSASEVLNNNLLRALLTISSPKESLVDLKLSLDKDNMLWLSCFRNYQDISSLDLSLLINNIISEIEFVQDELDDILNNVQDDTRAKTSDSQDNNADFMDAMQLSKLMLQV